MQTRWAGATGRFQGKCEQGHCALTGGRATSKHQGEVFTLLKYVLGHGRGDVSLPIGRREFRLDMVFNLPSGRVLVVEYDGAFWHEHQEKQDYWKARCVEAVWQDRGCVVVRIREDPLEPLHDRDVQVPDRSGPDICAKIVLIHLIHAMYPDFLEITGEDKVISFLRSAARPLTLNDLRCDRCRDVASYFLPDEITLVRKEIDLHQSRG